MKTVRAVAVPELDIARLRPLVGERRFARLAGAAASARTRLAETVVWNLSSTAHGGGVAEMLQVLCGYIRGVGVDVRWLVIGGDADFFTITKRLHNRLHGFAGDDGDLGGREADHYRKILSANAEDLLPAVRAGDVVLLHDPQTAGLAAALVATGAHVVWRCHVGSDTTNDWTEDSWRFLAPHLRCCDAFVFSRRSYVPRWIPDDKALIIPPSIDPFSPKNQDLSRPQIDGILRSTGIADVRLDDRPATFIRRDGSPGVVARRATIVPHGGALDPSVPLVLQVSRWDHLKDMAGVLTGFASRVVGRADAQLALVGPAVEGVDDDPEGAKVLAECAAAWEALPAGARQRIRLVTLPMDDPDENAAMVNALQRHAAVIVQKSLAEGFGLTVAEGMWKGKPVVATAVGGITDQIEPGTGILLDDPTDLDRFGDTLVGLLTHPDDMDIIGRRARRHVLDRFVGDRHLVAYAELVDKLVAVS